MGNKPARAVVIANNNSADRSPQFGRKPLDGPSVDQPQMCRPFAEVSWVGCCGFLAPLERGFSWFPNCTSA